MPARVMTIGAMRRRTLLLLAALLFLWPKYLVFAPSVSLFTVTVVLSYAICAIIVLTNRATEPLKPSAWLAVGCFFLFFLARIFADLSSQTPTESLYFDIRDLAWGGSLFLLAIILARGPNSLPRVAVLICLCAIIVLGIALLEHGMQKTFPAIVLEMFPIKLNEEYLSMLTVDKTRDLNFRAQGIYSHPIVFGEAAAAMLPVAIGVFLNRGGTRILGLLGALSCVAVAFLSGSRSGQIAVIFGVVFYIGLLIVTSRSKILWTLALFALPVMLISLPIVYDVAETLATGRSVSEKVSSNMRDLMWERGWPAIEARPLIGYGGGNSPAIAGIQARYGASFTIDDYYLSLLLDGGVLTVIALGLLVGAVALGTMTMRSPPPERRLRMAFLAGLFAVFVAQKATSLTEGVAFAYFYAGLLVAGQRYQRAEGRRPAQESRVPPAQGIPAEA